MNNVLLVFPYNLKDADGFEEIIYRFEEHGYMIQSFNDISRDNFYPEILPDILKMLEQQYGSIGRLVVLSNIQDAVFSWYRCYNSLVDDFIYFPDYEEKNLLISRKNDLIHNLSVFSAIEKEHIEGKIYIDLSLNYDKCISILSQLLRESNYRFFKTFVDFDFSNGDKKAKMDKEYIFMGERFLFRNGNNQSTLKTDTIEVPDNFISKFQVNEQFLVSLLKYDTMLFVFVIIGMHRVNPNDGFNLIFAFLKCYSREFEDVKDTISSLLLKYLNDNNVGFVEKVHILALESVVRGQEWQF